MTAPPAMLAAADRRLAALVAAFAPDAAGRLLGRLAGGEPAALGGSLAALPRAERLGELAGALASCAAPAGAPAARAVLEPERPRVARRLRPMVVGHASWPAGLPLLLARAALERLQAAPGGP